MVNCKGGGREEGRKGGEEVKKRWGRDGGGVKEGKVE
jgi:hypothetical protein